MVPRPPGGNAEEPVQVNAATSGISNAQAGVRLAQARLAASRAVRDNAALQLSYTTVTAPLGGIVSRKSVEVGQLVQPGQTLMSIVSDSDVYVTANFKETQLARIRVGQKVDLEIDAYGNEHAEGEIESIASAVTRCTSPRSLLRRDTMSPVLVRE